MSAGLSDEVYFEETGRTPEVAGAIFTQRDDVVESQGMSVTDHFLGILF
ncbi:MAG: hypothetical protein IID08_01165 [Candidatus Hydrogenedentes bacterium]|nr:hypothetical protein [Candidatus Hydrogenedentota bacterium]